MLRTKFAILLTALCLTCLANAEVLKVEAPVYVESINVTEIEYSEVEYKNFYTSYEYAFEVALDTNKQEQRPHRRQTELFTFANESLINSYQILEVGWQFSF